MNKDIPAVLCRILGEIIPELEDQKIDHDVPLADLGANSIDRADVITQALEELGLDIPLTSFAGKTSINDWAKVITDAMSK